MKSLRSAAPQRKPHSLRGSAGNAYWAQVSGKPVSCQTSCWLTIRSWVVRQPYLISSEVKSREFVNSNHLPQAIMARNASANGRLMPLLSCSEQ